jgi:uncharacterized protein
MFSAKLTKDQTAIIHNINCFIKDKHSFEQGHDYSHVLAVTHYSIEIARKISEPIDPFVVICGALFHDIGRVGTNTGRLHGLRGATIAEEYLKAIGIDSSIREQIVRIVVRHSETSMLPPETDAEKVVYDADDLDRLGLMGMLRGMMVGGAAWSMSTIINNRLEKRKKDYERLHFQVSRDLGRDLYDETLKLIEFIKTSMDKRTKEISKLDLPV